MGAEQFSERARGVSANDAFARVRDQALYDHGHSGYSGTIAEKTTFREFTPPAGVSGRELLQWYAAYEQGGPGRDLIPEAHLPLVKEISDVADDKWGPAACVRIEDGQWVFFGWASS